MNDQKDTTTPERNEQPAASALSASPGSPFVRAQVLIFHKELEYSVWVDVLAISTPEQLKKDEAELIEEIRDGTILGYRLFNEVKQQIGLPS